MTTHLDPADAIQAGLYSLLHGDATLLSLAGVYDDVLEDAAMPYVVIGETSGSADGEHGTPGRSTSVVLHTWTRARTSRTGNVIGARLVALLARQQATLDPLVTGHTVDAVYHEFSQTLRDPDPELRHRVDTFRIWTRQEAA